MTNIPTIRRTNSRLIGLTPRSPTTKGGAPGFCAHPSGCDIFLLKKSAVVEAEWPLLRCRATSCTRRMMAMKPGWRLAIIGWPATPAELSYHAPVARVNESGFSRANDRGRPGGRPLFQSSFSSRADGLGQGSHHIERGQNAVGRIHVGVVDDLHLHDDDQLYGSIHRDGGEDQVIRPAGSSAFDEVVILAAVEPIVIVVPAIQFAFGDIRVVPVEV